MANAGVVIIDSLKDMVSKLSDEEAGYAFNRFVQLCLANDIEVVALHHHRKANGANKRPNTLDDIHGSANLTRGFGW